jgi:hypothetical protein
MLGGFWLLPPRDFPHQSRESPYGSRQQFIWTHNNQSLTPSLVHRRCPAAIGKGLNAVIRGPNKIPTVATLSVAVDIRGVALAVGGESDEGMVGGAGEETQLLISASQASQQRPLGPKPDEGESDVRVSGDVWATARQDLTLKPEEPRAALTPYPGQLIPKFPPPFLSPVLEPAATRTKLRMSPR